MLFEYSRLNIQRNIGLRYRTRTKGLKKFKKVFFLTLSIRIAYFFYILFLNRVTTFIFFVTHPYKNEITEQSRPLLPIKLNVPVLFLMPKFFLLRYFPEFKSFWSAQKNIAALRYELVSLFGFSAQTRAKLPHLAENGVFFSSKFIVFEYQRSFFYSFEYYRFFLIQFVFKLCINLILVFLYFVFLFIFKYCLYLYLLCQRIINFQGNLGVTRRKK